MAFPATVLPLVTEVLIDGVWTNVTSGIHGVRRENGAGVRIARKPLSWAQRLSPATADHVFSNTDIYWSHRHPSSVNFGKLGPNTRIRHRLQWVYDTFTRSASSSWGSTDTGQAWTNTGGSASDFSVSGTKGQQTMTTTDVLRFSLVTSPVAAQDVTALIDVSAVATGTASLTARVVMGSDTSNFYAGRLEFTTASTVLASVQKTVAGTGTALTSSVNVGTYSAGTQYWVRLQRFGGGYLRVKAWLSTTAEPDAWTATTTTPDTSLTSFIKHGCVSRKETGNTNANPVISYDNFQVNDFRFTGEMPSLEPTTDDTGLDRYVPVQAAGITRRLTAGARPLRSAMYRAMAGISPESITPYAYWPMEDASGAAYLASAIPGHPAMTFTSGVSLAADSSFPGSDAVPLFATLNDSAKATVPAYADTGIWSAMLGVKPPAGEIGYLLIASMQKTNAIVAASLNLSTDQLTITVQTPSGINTSSVAVSAARTHGKPLLVVMTSTAGAPDTADVALYDIFGQQVAVVSQAVAGYHSAVSLLGVNGGGGNGLDGAAYGHLSVLNSDIFTIAGTGASAAWALGGYSGESAAARVSRLCREEGIYFELIGTASDTELCGPQRIGKLADVLVAAADVDQGILYEPRETLGYGYRTRTSLYNQTGPTLDYSAAQLSVFQTRDNTDDALNLVTASQYGGASATVEATSGRRSTQAPPNGIGVYDESRSWDIYSAAQLEPFAGWRTHRGSWDEIRYPAIGVALHRSQIATSPTLMASVAVLDLGSYLKVSNPRSDLPPDAIEVLVQGYDERMANFEWDIIWNSTPAGPFKVTVLNSATLGRLEGDHALHTAATTTNTSWDVATLSGPVMTTDDTDDGWQWMMEGELVTVTDVAPSTIAFGTVGTATHGVNAAVIPGAPAPIAAGDLLAVLAAIRNSGAGVPNTPSGWTRVPVFPPDANVQLFIKIAAGADAMPSVSFSGGVANADTTAQCARFTGKWHDAANIATRAGIASASCLNTSAQDIQLPGVPLTNIVNDSIVLYAGWKQDDWTSAATPSGYTEISEASTTTGDDQAFVWGYKVQATAAFVPPISLVVTGGASAISRGAFAVLYCDFQSCTVTRSVNGVVKSHAASTPTALYPAPHLAM